MEKTLKQSFSVFGKTTLRKFSKLKIYVQGLSKIGADLVTNLILLNPYNITLHDPELIQLQDCYSTFHYSKQYVNRKTRADSLIQICHRINNKVYVDKTNIQINQQECLKYDIIIFCDIYDLGRVIAINKAIRYAKQKTVVMYGCQMGFSGMVITDFGEEWEMFHSGQDAPRVPVKNISNSEKGVVETEYPHNYKTGDFITINHVEGMKYVNGDARPITVVNQFTFQIEDTRAFGEYTRGGLCEKINLLQKLKFTSFEDQLSRRHSEMMLIYKSIVCFYQNNSKLPEIFNSTQQEETMQNLKTLANKFDQKFNETNCRNVIKTCGYNFYPLINMFSAILTLQCIKCTGKYRPIVSPFLIDWYSKISFEEKKKIEGQFFNIIDTNVLEKLYKLQVAVVDDGSHSLQLLSLLYSCSIAQKTRIVLCGLQSINETQDIDSLVLKAQIKYQVTSQLFKSKKTETMPCSLSFSNDLLLEDMWKKVKLLINTSSRLNQYIYNNVIWNQISVVDSCVMELNAEVKISAPNVSELQSTKVRGQGSSYKDELTDFRDCVERVIEIFRIIFIDIFEDMRCFFICGTSYIDKVKMEAVRKDIFLFMICCLEDGAHLQPQNIVKISKFIFEELFINITLDSKDQLIMDFMKSLYFLITWFFSGKQIKIEEITNNFVLFMNKKYDEPSLTEKEKFSIAFTKLAMGNQFKIPYLSLSELYRKEHVIKFIWNGSQILARKLLIDEEITSKKFYKYYYRKIKPCPFMMQIVNSLIPLMILESAYKKTQDFQVDLIASKITPKQCAPPKKMKPSANTKVLIPGNANQWTIIIIQGPKKIAQIIERFSLMENIKVNQIKYETIVLYDSNNPKKSSNCLENSVEELISMYGKQKQKKDEYELYLTAVDKEGRQCQLCRVKYISK